LEPVPFVLVPLTVANRTGLLVAPFVGETDFVAAGFAAAGFVATDFNQHRGPRTVAQGAEIIVRLATLREDGPTAGFFDEQGIVAW
jgi:hypothetical protein